MARENVRPLLDLAPAAFTGTNTHAELLAVQHAGSATSLPWPGIFTPPSISTDVKSELAALHTRPRGREVDASKAFGLARVPWLLVVLAIQAALSLRLVRSNTAFSDEGLYLWSGTLEWQHWLHGTSLKTLPDFPAYFSGAPTVYPPIGALANHFAGLAGARVLSLGFMLIANVLLFLTTRRLFSRNAGIFASGVFAATAATQYLGAFATYDAMALMLISLSAWLTVAAAQRSLVGALFLGASSGVVLAIADTAKYAATLWDPAVIALAVLVSWKFSGRLWQGVVVGCMCLSVVVATIIIDLRLGGHSYWLGIVSTTLSRQQGTSSALGITVVSLGWVGLVAGLALVGAVVVTKTYRDLPTRLTAWVLTGAVALAPANQARIHVFTSLFKHVGFGAWFAAVVAGVALAALPEAVPKAKRAKALQTAVAAVVGVSVVGILLAGAHFTNWPNSTKFTVAMRSVLAHVRGPVLASDNGNVIEYYLPSESSREYFYGTGYFRYQDPRTRDYLVDAPAYAEAIKRRFFDVISLNFDDSAPAEVQIAADIKKYGGYRLVNTLPYRLGRMDTAFRIWVKEGQ
jgi:hypothetical protein